MGSKYTEHGNYCKFPCFVNTILSHYSTNSIMPSFAAAFTCFSFIFCLFLLVFRQPRPRFFASYFIFAFFFIFCLIFFCPFPIMYYKARRWLIATLVSKQYNYTLLQFIMLTIFVYLVTHMFAVCLWCRIS